MTTPTTDASRFSLRALVFAIPILLVVFLFVWFDKGDLADRLIPHAGVVERGQFGDSFGVLNSLFSGLGFAAVAITILIQQRQISNQQKERQSDEEYRRSLFNLEKADEAYQTAIDTLEQGGNNRRAWVHSARLISHAMALADGVTVENHKRVLDYMSLRYRAVFHDFLHEKPASFFYGVDPSMQIDEAAKASTVGGMVNGRHSLNSVRMIDERSIYAVWKAAQWPEDYAEPSDAKFSDVEIEKLYVSYPAVKEFLDHRKKKISIFGQLLPIVSDASPAA